MSEHVPDIIDGVWRRMARDDGVSYRVDPESHYTYVFLTVEVPSPWRGIFAFISYGYEGGHWTTQEVIEIAHRHMVNGEPRPIDPTKSKADIYCWSAGLFRTSAGTHFSEIDMQQHWKGCDFFSPYLGIYKLLDDRLTICQAWEGFPRPTSFKSDARISQSLTELDRIK